MWDNAVFGVNQMEAETMDPQHKLALEVSFKALEDAGISLQRLRGSNTAVYMGKLESLMLFSIVYSIKRREIHIF